MLLPRSNISLDRKKSQFSTYLHENGEGKVDSWEGLWGLKTLVDLGEQQADNTSTPSSNPNPQQQPFLLSGLSIDKIYWHVVQIKLIKARSTKIHRWGSCWKTFVSKQKKSSSYHQLFLSNTKGKIHLSPQNCFLCFDTLKVTLLKIPSLVPNSKCRSALSFSFAKLVHIPLESFTRKVWKFCFPELQLLCHSFLTSRSLVWWCWLMV